jgi:hypothetical protein
MSGTIDRTTPHLRDETMTTGESAHPAATTDRAALRAELESARRDYHELLNKVTRASWKTKSGNPAWTVGQLMYHISSSAAFVPPGIERAKQGKGFNPPLADFANVWFTRLGALRATRASCAEQYADAYAKLLTALDQVKDDEWQKGAKNFGQYQTVADLFRSVKEHVDEHGAQIRAALG